MNVAAYIFIFELDPPSQSCGSRSLLPLLQTRTTNGRFSRTSASRRTRGGARAVLAGDDTTDDDEATLRSLLMRRA